MEGSFESHGSESIGWAVAVDSTAGLSRSVREVRGLRSR